MMQGLISGAVFSICSITVYFLVIKIFLKGQARSSFLAPYAVIGAFFLPDRLLRTTNGGAYPGLSHDSFLLHGFGMGGAGGCLHHEDTKPLHHSASSGQNPFYDSGAFVLQGGLPHDFTQQLCTGIYRFDFIVPLI